MRYYTCILSKTRIAEQAGVPRCHMGWVPADALEATAWEAITTALLDDDMLESAFAALEEQSAAVDATTVERMAELGR